MTDIRCTAYVRRGDPLLHPEKAGEQRCRRKALTSGTIEVEVWVVDVDDGDNYDGHYEAHEVPYVPGRCHQHQNTTYYKEHDWYQTEQAMRPEWDRYRTYDQIWKSAMSIFVSNERGEVMQPTRLTNADDEDRTIIAVEGFLTLTPYPDVPNDPARLRWMADNYTELAVRIYRVADQAEVEMDSGIAEILDNNQP